MCRNCLGYTVAKLYAKMGFADRSLEYLRRAMEEGYKDYKNVYKDEEFAGLRKDKRFYRVLGRAKTSALYRRATVIAVDGNKQ
jgi:hypothetical protein